MIFRVGCTRSFASALVTRALPLACLGLVVAPRDANAGPGPGQSYYVYQDLGAVLDSSAAYDINDAKQVAGFAASGAISQAVLWTPPGSMLTLGTTGNSSALGIDASGRIVGSSWTVQTNVSAFVWSSPGPMTTLGDLGGTQEAGVGLNNLGQIVGHADSGGLSTPVLWNSPGLALGLGSLGGNWGEAHDINDAGTVVGSSKNASGVPHAFFWTQTTGLKALAELTPNNFSSADAINASGQVVGSAYIGEFPHAVLWPSTGSAAQDLGTLAGGLESWANDVNDGGAIVGVSAGNGEFAFQRDTSGMHELDVPSGLLGASANAINNDGDVAGAVTVANGKLHAVVWWHYVVPPAPFPIPQQTLALGPGPMSITVLGSRSNDVRIWDPATFTIGNGVQPEASDTFRGRVLVQYLDTNRDGLLDMVLGFEKADLIANGDLGRTTSALWVQGASQDRRRGFVGVEPVRVTG